MSGYFFSGFLLLPRLPARADVGFRAATRFAGLRVLPRAACALALLPRADALVRCFVGRLLLAVFGFAFGLGFGFGFAFGFGLGGAFGFSFGCLRVTAAGSLRKS